MCQWYIVPLVSSKAGLSIASKRCGNFNCEIYFRTDSDSPENWV